MSKVNIKQLAKIIADKSLNLEDSSTLAKDIAAYLIKERRTNELDSLLRDVQVEWAKAGRLDVSVKSARPLDQQTLNDLTSPFKSYYPEAKSVSPSLTLEDNVIGGAVAELGDLRLDLSLARRIRVFKQSVNN